MKKYILFLLSILLFSFKGFSQTTEGDTLIRVPKEAWKKYFQDYHDTADVHHEDHAAFHEIVIATDRPDQTETPILVPAGYFQIETGSILEKDKDENNDYINTTYNTTLWKYGVNDNFELRFITEYLGEQAHKKTGQGPESGTYYPLDSSSSGFNSVAAGAKFAICKETRFFPQISLITHVQLPYFGSSSYKPNFIAPRFRFLFQHALSNTFTFSYNLGAEWDGINPNTTLIYTASLGINLFANAAMFVESYGFMTENNGNDARFNGTFIHDHRVDGGFTYILTNNLQLDLSGGVGISEISPSYFLSSGVSWRFALKKPGRRQ